MKKDELRRSFSSFVSGRRFFLVSCCAWLLLAASGRAGSSPEGFVGVPWKATPFEAKQVMLARQGVRVTEETPGRLVFLGGTYADLPVERWELDFDYGHFERGRVFLTVPAGTAKDGRPVVDHQFDDLLRALDVKYGNHSGLATPGAAEGLWKWNVPDPHSGNRLVRSVLLSYKWSTPSAPLVFKVQYANQLRGDPEIPGGQGGPESPETSSSGAPKKKSDL